MNDAKIKNQLEKKTKIYRQVLSNIITAADSEINLLDADCFFDPSNALQSTAYDLIQRSIQLQALIQFYDKLSDQSTP